MIPFLLGSAAFLYALRPKDVLARATDSGLVEGIGRLSSRFGPRTLPGEVQKMHWGVDIMAQRKNAEVRSVASGKVVDVSADGVRSGYGNTVIVEHLDGTLTLYAHLDRFGGNIRDGALVEKGTVLGYVGATHAPSKAYMAPHLHFEVLKSKVTTPAGRIVVTPTTPQRHEPVAWLGRRNVKIADIG